MFSGIRCSSYVITLVGRGMPRRGVATKQHKKCASGIHATAQHPIRLNSSSRHADMQTVWGRKNGGLGRHEATGGEEQTGPAPMARHEDAMRCVVQGERCVALRLSFHAVSCV